MPIKYYTDAHISRVLVAQLRLQGIEVTRCQDVDMADAKDSAHLIFATSRQLTVITGDEDFLVLDAVWRIEDRSHCGIVYVRPEKREAIGIVLEMLVFLHAAVEGGAASLEQDIFGKVIRV